MKKTILFYPILLLITALLFSGCLVTSIHPLGTGDDIIFDENLIGMWMENDDDFWTFSKGEKNTYNLIISGDDNVEEFSAKLVKLCDKLFLDIYPERLDTGNIVTDVLMLPTHTFLRFSRKESELSLGFTDPEWFTDRIDQNEEIDIEYLITEDEVITLTASTEELQVFYLKHADDDEFFDLDDDKLIKVEEGILDEVTITFTEVGKNGEEIILKGVVKNGEEIILKGVDKNGEEIIVKGVCYIKDIKGKEK